MSKRPARRAKSAPARSSPKGRIDWIVYRIGGARATMIGHVTADTEAQALSKAFEEFGIAQAERERIIVRPASKG